MRTTRALQIKVGLLIGLSLLILAAVIFLMGKERRLFESKVSFSIHFSRASGLREGSPISLSGVRVGSVESLSFPPDPRENYVIVHVGVVKEAAPRIHKDMVARLRTQGLLGDKYIDLSGGSPESQRVPPGGVIPSADPVDYETLLGQSGDLIEDVTEAASSLRTILKSIEEGKGFLGQAMVDDGKWAETSNNLRLASASLKNILGSVEKGEGMLGQLVQNREAGQAMMRDLRTTLAHLGQASESIQKTAQKIEKGEGTLGTLIQDPQSGKEILAGLRQSVANLESVTGQLRQGGGLLPRLLADKPYADRVLGRLDQTTKDLAQITGRIERGEGTLGALVNDPELYKDAKEMLGKAKGSWLYSIYRFFSNLGSSGETSQSGGSGEGSKKQAD